MTSAAKPGPAEGTGVLRNVQWQAQPLTLRRPGVTGAAARQAPASWPAGVKEVSPASADVTQAVIAPAMLAEARAEGVAQGRAAERKDAEQQLRAALEEARKQGMEEGRLQGQEQGRSEALAKMEAWRSAEQAKLAARHERLDAVTQGVEARADQARREAEDDMVALCHEVICRVVGTHAATPEGLAAMVRGLLAQRAGQSALMVHVHPEDFRVVNEAGLAQQGHGWRWVADAAVVLGGVILKSSAGTLDARLETQMAKLRLALMNARQSASAAPQGAAAGLRP